MRKVAVFVEGMTEQRFVVNLVEELLGNKAALIQRGELHKGAINYQPITGTRSDTAATVMVLVVDCRGDEQVKTQIRDQYQWLVAAGYGAILGLRDVYPFLRAKIPNLQAALNAGLPTYPVVPSMHLAVMEIEAWFIAETTHFDRLHPALTVAAIGAGGFNVHQPCEAWNHPAETLDEIYKLVGCRYLKRDGSKSNRRVSRTLKALSFDRLYEVNRPAIVALDAFVFAIEGAIF